MNENHSPETILQEVLELADLQERAAYRDEACRGDQELRQVVESLLAARFAADALLNTVADPGWSEVAGEKEGDSIGRYKLLQQIGSCQKSIDAVEANGSRTGKPIRLDGGERPLDTSGVETGFGAGHQPQEAGIEIAQTINNDDNQQNEPFQCTGRRSRRSGSPARYGLRKG